MGKRTCSRKKGQSSPYVDPPVDREDHPVVHVQTLVWRSKAVAFDYMDLFKTLSVVHSGTNKEEFVNERARKLLDDVCSLQNQYAQSSEYAGTQPTLKELSVEAASGVKKRRIFGSGSEAAALTQTPMLSSIGTSTSNALEIEQMQKKLMQIKLSIMKMKFSVYKKHVEWNASMMKKVCKKVGIQPLPPNPINLEEMFNIDDEDNIEQMQKKVDDVEKQMEIKLNKIKRNCIDYIKAQEELNDSIVKQICVKAGIELPPQNPINFEEIFDTDDDIDDDDISFALVDHHPLVGSGSNPPPPPPPPPSATAPAYSAL